MERLRTALRFCAALALVAGAALAFAPPEAAAAETRTLKEKLSDKASDEQRVDNCGVPPERHGKVPRPGCRNEKPALPAAAGQEDDEAPVAPAAPRP